MANVVILLPPQNLAYLLKYDSVYGRYEKEVEASESSLIINGKGYRMFNEKDALPPSVSGNGPAYH